MKNGHLAMTKGMVNGSIAASTTHTGSKLMKNIAKHPVLVFGLGAITGYLIYRYRKEIIASSSKVVGASKDFVLQQKENLEDIIAESRE